MSTLPVSKTSISTCTYIANLNSCIDLDCIYNKIKLDKTIIGLKYNNCCKGDISKTKSFFNQLTIKLYIKKFKKETNLKVFSNGKFQLTGVKTFEQAEECLKIFCRKIAYIKGYETREIKVVDGIIHDKTDFDNLVNFDRFNFIKIYKKIDGEYRYLGDKKADNKYIINKNYVCFCPERKWFIDIAHKNFTKIIYNIDGVYIGHCKYKMHRKLKNLILQDTTMKQKEDDKNVFTIFNKYSNVIGEKHIVIEKNACFPTRDDNLNGKVKIYYSAVKNEETMEALKNEIFYHKAFEDRIQLQLSNINSNFKIDLGDNSLNKNVIHETMTQKYNFLSYYKPDSKYQAINIAIYLNENFEVIKISKKFTYKVTITIFQNGKIMISGCKSLEQIPIIKKMILDIFSENSDTFLFSKQKIKLETELENLTIWDLI